MNLLDAFKQYIRDAMPGGALNPEVTTQGVLDTAALGTAPVPILGDAIGLAADVRRLAKNPEERTPLNFTLAGLGALPFVPSGLGTIKKVASKAPQADALATAQKNAVTMLGLPPNNTAMDRAKALGYEDFYHGTRRLDRLLEKKGLDPRRATSGPMPFGTDSVDIASSYAMNKADTSMLDDGDIASYFKVSPKDIGITGRTPVDVERSWNFLPREKKGEILAKAKRVGYSNLDDASGGFKLHPEGVDASLSGSHFDYLMKTEARGNPLTALRQMWHDGGDLVDNPEDLETIFRLAGYNAPISQATAPWFTANGVLPGMSRVTSPLDTSDTKTLAENVVPRLKEAFKSDRTRLREYGADMWDKNTRFTPKDWVSELEKDLASGKNSNVWTSIPDKVTSELKSLGYNGIFDTGGKMGGNGHKVIIPFEPSQVRSRFAAFDPARVNENDLLGAASLPMLGLLAGGSGALAYTRSERDKKDKK